MRYRTAWRLKHKIMQAMTEREATRQLSGCAQVDDAYLGGERNGGKPGRVSENKQPLVIAVQTDSTLEHPTFALIEPVRAFDNVSLRVWAERRLAPEGRSLHRRLGLFSSNRSRQPRAHGARNRRGRAATEVQGARWVNVLLSNLKRGLNRVYHSIRQAKYARRYLAEAAHRFTRRFRLREMASRLATAVMACKPCLERIVRQACSFVD